MMKQMETLNSLPSSAKLTVMAFSIVLERVGSLPKADRDDLFDLVLALREANNPVDRKQIEDAMEEILIGPVPVSTQPFPLPEVIPEGSGLKKWSEHVGGRIKELREHLGLTQVDLAGKTGLTQSHISRLESATHSATNKTLEKIAQALGVPIKDLDPCAE